MLAIAWPETGIGWVVFGVIVVVIVLGLAYLHIRDENVRSIRLGIFLERERRPGGDDGERPIPPPTPPPPPPPGHDR